MKIGIFTDTYFPQVNGVTFTISAWKKKLEEKGHKVYIYYPAGKYKPQKRELPFRSVDLRFYDGYKVAVPSRRMNEINDLEIVHIHGLFGMAMAGLYVSKKYRLPKILTYHTQADEYLKYITKNKPLKKTLMELYSFWEKRLLNSCQIVTCPSNTTKEKLLDKGVKNLTILSNGIDLDFFKPVKTEKFKNKYNIKAKRVIGFCGRLDYGKHLEDLIEISNKFDGEIIIVGEGPAKNHYQKIAAGKKNIKFMKFLSREEILSFYSLLDFFIFPSTAETQGLVALEAMACGTPVIGGSAIALKEIIRDGMNGYLYKKEYKNDLIKKIELAYKNKDKLSNNCRKYVTCHSIDKTIEKLIKIYEKLLASNKK